MTEDELKLWERHGQRDEAAGQELILLYLPLVEVLAKRIAWITGAAWEDLRQEGIIGLIKAIAGFDTSQGAPFRSFAKKHICGAIFDSSEITRNMARRQYEIYRKVRKTEDELIQTLQRNPTIEEVAEKAQLTIDQMQKAIDAKSVAFPGPMSDDEDLSGLGLPDPPPPQRTQRLLEALGHLSEREQTIIRLYYWEDMPHKEIARTLGLTVSNVIKIRQRALAKLRKLVE